MKTSKVLQIMNKKIKNPKFILNFQVDKKVLDYSSN